MSFFLLKKSSENCRSPLPFSRSIIYLIVISLATSMLCVTGVVKLYIKRILLLLTSSMANYLIEDVCLACKVLLLGSQTILKFAK